MNNTGSFCSWLVVMVTVVLLGFLPMALKANGVSRDIISEAMGHSDTRTTDHYLSEFDHSVLDRADEGLF